MPRPRHERALLATEGRPWIGRPLAIAALTEALSAQGQLEESEALLATCDESDVVPWTLEGRALLEQRGRLRAIQSRPAEALADLLLAGHHAEEGGIDNPAVTCWRAGAVLAFRTQRRTDEAVQLSLAEPPACARGGRTLGDRVRPANGRLGGTPGRASRSVARGG